MVYCKPFFVLLTVVLAIPLAQAKILEASCRNFGAEVTTQVTSRIFLKKSIVDRLGITPQKRQKIFEEAATQHSLYLAGALQKRFLRDTDDIVTTKELTTPSVTLIGQQKRTTDLYLFDVVHPDVQIRVPYLIESLKQKQFPTGTEEYIIAYSGEMKFVTCTPNPLLVGKTLKVNGPRDPWLAHWPERPDLMRDVKWAASKFMVPVYSDSEYSDIPHPEYLWYYWDPGFSGKDLNGIRYDARKLMTQADFSQGTFEVIKNQKITGPGIWLDRTGFSDRPSLQATAIFGVLDTKLKFLDIGAIFPKASAIFSPITWDNVEAALDKAALTVWEENGSNYAIGFLREIPKIFDPASLEISRVSPDTFKIRGLLKNSAKPMTLTFFFGITDLLGPITPNHWNLAAKGLSEDDMVFYVGHSGLGENFRLENIKKYSKKSVVLGPHLKVLGLFSCFSMHYFEDGFYEAAKSHPRTQRLLTGSSFVSPKMVSGVIKFVDNLLVGGSAKPLPDVESEAFLILTQNEKER